MGLELRCIYCGSPYMRNVEGALWECLVCGGYMENRGGRLKHFTFEVFSRPRVEFERLISKGASEVGGGLEPEDYMFAKAVVNRLTKSDEVARRWREWLLKVLAGQMDFNDWFEMVRVQAGLKVIDLATIIYEELRKMPIKYRNHPVMKEFANSLKRTIEIESHYYAKR